MENNKIDSIIKKGLFVEIQITKGDDKEFDEACNNFLQIMEEEVKKFEKLRNKEVKEWEKENINPKEIFFESEHISKKSPITIIDAPWGTGKTYFVERIIKFFNKNKNNRFFKKIIFLDGWKYSTSKNIPNDLICKLIYSLQEVTTTLNTNIEKYKKMEGKDFSIDYDDLAGHINDLDRTIVFIDNVERLGKDAWEILKGIWRLSEANNFLFVLPMNQSQLDKSILEHSKEAFFEKYIDIRYIKFSQNYLGLLLNMGFSERISVNLNKFLDNDIDGQKLSIREVKKRIKANDLLKISKKNDYLMLRIFTDKIWGSKKIVREFILNDVREFVDTLHNMGECYYEVQNAVFKLLSKIAMEEKNKYNEVYKNKINHKFEYSTNITFDWTKTWDKFCQNLIEEDKSIDDLLKEKKIIISKIKKTLTALNNGKSKLNDKIIENNKKLDVLFANKDSYSEIVDSKKVILLKSTIAMDSEQLNEKEKVWQRKAHEENEIDFQIKQLLGNKETIQATISILKSSIIDFNKIKNTWLNAKNENKYIWNKFDQFLTIENEEEINLNNDYWYDNFIDLLLNY